MLKDQKFSYSYTSGEKGNSPVDFCKLALSNSIQFDLGLGYFSSTSINVLAEGFARFVVAGGNMRLYINEHISEEDYNLIKNGDPANIETRLLQEYEALKQVLSKRDEHFFKCISLLIKEKRIEIRIVVMRNGGLAHQKVGIFTDSEGNKVSFTGSLNMTASALVSNLETIECTCSWRGEDSMGRVEDCVRRYETMWNGGNEDTIVYDAKHFCQQIVSEYPNITRSDVLEEEEKLSKTFVLESNKESVNLNRPHFPEGCSPFDYQIEAYNAWVENDHKGIFAMATGTGKTITSLNCALNEYYKTEQYQLLILVPTIALVDQWKDEVRSFGFGNIIEVSSANPEWRRKLTQLKNNIRFTKVTTNFVIISTYDSYKDADFQQLVNQLPEDLIVIADEAHNIGSKSVRKAFKTLKAQRRIALSATPSRIYDAEGTAEIESFFNDTYPYIVNFSMAKAMEKGRLMNYNYYPVLVVLDDEEMEEYANITRQIMWLYDAAGNCKDKSKAERLLQDRKRILHKANDKIGALKKIVRQIGEERLKYCFVYVPEGISDNDCSTSISNDSPKIIDHMLQAIKDVYPSTRCNTYIGEKSKRERRDILEGFREGRIDVLLAMKCLDEGVDVPRTQYGIFASSTGNPRQYIQRRGRLLRKHDDKEHAYIYDMIVIPNSVIYNIKADYHEIERKLVQTELSRVAYFAQLASNYYTEVQPALKSLIDFYELDISQMILSITQ